MFESKLQVLKGFKPKIGNKCKVSEYNEWTNFNYLGVIWSLGFMIKYNFLKFLKFACSPNLL
jgi:hypothetical protein